MITAQTRLRKRLFAIHGWLGLHVGLWLFVVCLSGALVVFALEIEWLIDPALRIQPGGAVRWQQTYDALRRAYPDYQVHSITRGEQTVLESQAWIAYMTAPDGRYGVTRVDPFAARVVRPFTTLHIPHFLDQLHFYLYSPPALIGVYVVTSLAAPLLVSLVTGVLFQRRWWRHLFQLRVGSARRLSWSSAHRFVGVWTLAFGLIISVTGIWYLVEQAVVPVEIAYPNHPAVPENRMIAYGPTPSSLSLQMYIDAAARVFPELEPTAIDLPGAPNGSVAIKGPAAGRLLVRDRANAVFLDPFDASVVAIRRSNEATWLTWWVDAADPLHFGFWGGLPSKVLWCVLGLCLPGLVLTGAYLAVRRAEVGGASARRGGRRWRVSVQWGLAAALVVGSFASCVTAYWRLTPRARVMVEVGAKAVGPWVGTVSREATVGPKNGNTAYSLRLEAGADRQANVKRAALWFGDSPTATGRAEFSGQAHAMRAVVLVPSDLTRGTTVTLVIEGWSGARHVTVFPEALDHRLANDATVGPAGPAESDGAGLPPVPLAFFVIVGGFAATVGSVISAWLWAVARPLRLGWPPTARTLTAPGREYRERDRGPIHPDRR